MTNSATAELDRYFPDLDAATRELFTEVLGCFPVAVGVLGIQRWAAGETLDAQQLRLACRAVRVEVANSSSEDAVRYKHSKCLDLGFIDMTRDLRTGEIANTLVVRPCDKCRPVTHEQWAASKYLPTWLQPEPAHVEPEPAF